MRQCEECRKTIYTDVDINFSCSPPPHISLKGSTNFCTCVNKRDQVIRFTCYNNALSCDYYPRQLVCCNCDKPSWQYVLKGKSVADVQLLPCEHCGCHSVQPRKLFWRNV